jgi:hypothetical protein
MKEVSIDADDVIVKEFEHPNGETGILLALQVSEATLVDLYDLGATPDPDSGLVMPLKHKADGATNFQEYREEDGDIVVVHTDDQYAEVRERLEMML